LQVVRWSDEERGDADRDEDGDVNSESDAATIAKTGGALRSAHGAKRSEVADTSGEAEGGGRDESDVRAVTDVAVAVHAVEHFAAIARVGVDARDDLLVAAHAVALKNGGVFRPDHDRLVKILEGETFRMPVAVLGFGQVFSDDVVWGVAVVAGGDGVMRRL
jgi:hypothetical protein